MDFLRFLLPVRGLLRPVINRSFCQPAAVAAGYRQFFSATKQRDIPSAPSKVLHSSPVVFPTCRSYAKKLKKDKGAKGSALKTDLSTEEMEGVLDIDRFKSELQQAVDQLKEEYIQHLALRTTAGVFDSILVETDDGKFPLNQLGQVVQKNPNLVIINMAAMPQYLKDVKNSLVSSGMNLNPQQEGTTLFLPIPKITKEHRENMAKNAKMLCDRTKDKLRDVHKVYAKKLKRAGGSQSEDLIRNLQELVLSLMHEKMESANRMMHQKQQDLLGKK